VKLSAPFCTVAVDVVYARGPFWSYFAPPPSPVLAGASALAALSPFGVPESTMDALQPASPLLALGPASAVSAGVLLQDAARSVTERRGRDRKPRIVTRRGYHETARGAWRRRLSARLSSGTRPGSPRILAALER
jgi:hypothetical protein